MRFAIWRNTLAVIAAYVVVIYAADRTLLRDAIASRPLALALAFTIVQVTVVGVMLLALFVWKRRNVLRNERSARLGPAIDEALAMHTVGEDRTEELRKLAKESRYDVRERLLAAAATTRGEARERVLALIEYLQLIRRRRDMELQSVRDLIRVGHGSDFADVVKWASSEPLLVRALIADEFAPYAGEIDDEQIVAALSSPDRRVVLTALEMLVAWRRTVRVPGFTMLLANPDRRVRERAFDALGYVAASQPPEVVAEAIITGLRHDDERVRAAAARAAGRHGVTSASEALAGRLSDSSRVVAVAAANSLASLGDFGMAFLEQSLALPDRRAVSVAFEAWEKVAIGKLETS